MLNIADIRHPQYILDFEDYLKFRLTYEGGKCFINEYLNKLSERESDSDFALRKQLAYCPAFASAAITRIKNAIFQRTTDIQRLGGPESYQQAIKEYIDFDGNNINTFVGMFVLEELLVLGRVGVLTDMPDNLGSTILDRGNKRPYLGIFCAENIRSWTYKSTSTEKYLTSILLQEFVDIVDEKTGLVEKVVTTFRLIQLVNDGVKVTFYDSESTIKNSIVLNLKRIPFTLFQLPYSLMMNVADYQIALMNLESSDISFARRANFPIFYEFVDPKSEQIYKKPPGPPNTADGTAAIQGKSKDREVSVGMSKGRRYALGVNAPGFVSPDPEVLRVSMEKGNQLKDDIFELVNLNVSNLSASAESKQADQGTLESGLSFIGLVLAKGENDIARHWAEFENVDKKATVTYPENYSIESGEERRKKGEHLEKMANKVTSPTYKKEVQKRLAKVTIGPYVKESDLQKIYSEIDNAKTLTCDPDQVIADHEAGLVSDKTASIARGYPEGEVEQARKDKAQNIKMTMEAQGGPQGAGAARGAPAFGGATSSLEKRGKKKRGTADKVIKDEK